MRALTRPTTANHPRKVYWGSVPFPLVTWAPVSPRRVLEKGSFPDGGK